MIKALLYKQWQEMMSGFFQDKKTGKARSKTTTVLYLVLYAFLFVFLAAMFGLLSLLLAPTLAAFDLGWLYFAMTGLMGILFGLFGSVFQTYAFLYCAKDNDMLLSMPIPPKYILIARLASIWVWAFAFEAIVLLPASIIYWIFGSHSFLTVFCSCVMILILPFFILALSCLLGYGIAKLSSLLKGKKNIILSVFAVAGIAVYYYVCSKAYEIIEQFLAQAIYYGQVVREKASVIYYFGRSFEGGLLPLLCVFAIILASFCLMWYVMSRSFIKLATIGSAKDNTKKEAKVQKQKNALWSLTVKELRRFASSTTYMLNCGIGTILLPIVGVVALVKGADLRAMLLALSAENPAIGSLLAGGVCLLICALTSMNDMAAPSISLEGKYIWIAQSLPLPTWKILWSKILMHLILTVPVTLFASICAIIALRLGFVLSVLTVIVPLLFVLLTAVFGVCVNLKLPNLKWTNETVPVKQSMAVGLSMLGGFLVVGALAVGYFFLALLIPAWLCLLLCGMLFALVTVCLSIWLYYRGTKIFETL